MLGRNRLQTFETFFETFGCDFLEDIANFLSGKSVNKPMDSS